MVSSCNRVNSRPSLTLAIVTGDHAFQMPDYAAGDVRGPCPGLNTLANHGYLPRNGIATVGLPSSINSIN
jgi:hypothetical protein